MNRIPNNVLSLVAPHLPKRNLGRVPAVSKTMRRVFGNQVQKRTRNTNTRHMLLLLAAKLARRGGPRQYTQMQSSVYKALLNFEKTRINLTNQQKRVLANARRFVHNMPPNTGIYEYGSLWVNPTFLNNAGRPRYIYIQYNGRNNVMVYNPLRRRYNLV